MTIAIAEQFEHAADVGVRGIGATPEEAFAGAARALTRLLAEEPGSVRESEQLPIACEAAGLEELLPAFLDELIYLFASRRIVLARLELAIDASASAARLVGHGWGERWDPTRHAATVEPKGATFTALKVARQGTHWIAQCVVDV